MQRYFVEQLDEKGQVHIQGDDFFHLTKVMRCALGDQIYCVVNEKTAVTSIIGITNGAVVASPIEWLEDDVELPVNVSIACGLSKGDKLEWVVQKCTELGATQFIPWQATRSVVKWDSAKSAKKVERLGKIAKEAAEQSHRTRIPIVWDVVSIAQLIEQTKDHQIKIVAYEDMAKQGEKQQLATLLQQLKPCEKMVIVFGPEGGLERDEVDQLVAAGFHCCGLGARILRTETAPLFVMSAIGYELELR